MIIKVLFKIEGEPVTMMFGDSYKSWKEQYSEFYRSTKYETKGLIELIAIWECKDKWIGWGGLKWCSEKNFQECLNREGCQEEDKDNPNPRKYTNMKFRERPLSKLHIK